MADSLLSNSKLKVRHDYQTHIHNMVYLITRGVAYMRGQTRRLQEYEYCHCEEILIHQLAISDVTNIFCFLTIKQRCAPTRSVARLEVFAKWFVQENNKYIIYNLMNCLGKLPTLKLSLSNLVSR